MTGAAIAGGKADRLADSDIATVGHRRPETAITVTSPAAPTPSR
jgi:hypothetical protein